MDAIIIIICFFTLLSHSFQLRSDDSQVMSTNSSEIKHGINSTKIPNCILDRLKNKRYLYYSIGHHGYNWAVVFPDSVGLSFFRGSTQSIIEENYEEMDTSRFFLINQDIFKWAFDSLYREARDLSPIDDNKYSPVYTHLKSYDKDHNELFSLDNAGYFSGNNSVYFNKRIAKLKMLMLWLSSPEMRKYINLND